MNKTRQQRRPATIVGLVALGIVLSAIGCGRRAVPMGTLEGSVSINGVADGLEAFRVCVGSAAGYGGLGPVERDGTFRIDGNLPVGDYRVWLEEQPSVANPFGPTMPAKKNSPGQAKRRVDKIPPSYRTERATPLSVTIAPGLNQFPIEIAD